MSKSYYGSINLDAIKEAIVGGVKPVEGKKGKYLPVNIWVNDEPDQFGNEVSISVYNKETKQKTYLGNLKASQFSGGGQQASLEAQAPDLPF